MKTIVVIPAYNEKKRIKNVLLKIKNLVDNIIVVDDGSQDGTYEVIKDINERIIALKHRINLGKGAALKTGCEAAISLGAENIILMDADGQHNPEDIPYLLEKLNKNDLDIVFGSRKIGKDMPLIMFLGNKFLSLATSILFGIYISDTQSGFRAFKSEIYPKIKWNSTKYSVETEMIVNTGKNKLKFGEVEIKTIYRDKYKGTTIFDGIKIFFNMIIWKII